MSKVTKYKPGAFCWVDLATSDETGASAFYTALFGWTTSPIPMGPDFNYVMCSLNGEHVGALFAPPAEHTGGLPPHWKSYVSVVDADANAARAAELGGTVAYAPMDVPGSGRMAILIDPTGAMIATWQSSGHSGAGVVNEPGSLVWNELLTSDTKVAGDFYTALFDWTSEEIDMGSMKYTILSNDGRPNGGMMQITEQMGPIPPNWMVYFAVEDTDDSAALVTELGGKIFMPPTDIPEVGRFAVVADPQGAVFGIIKMNREPTPYPE